MGNYLMMKSTIIVTHLTHSHYLKAIFTLNLSFLMLGKVGKFGIILESIYKVFEWFPHPSNWLYIAFVYSLDPKTSSGRVGIKIHHTMFPMTTWMTRLIWILMTMTSLVEMNILKPSLGGPLQKKKKKKKNTNWQSISGHQFLAVPLEKNRSQQSNSDQSNFCQTKALQPQAEAKGTFFIV